MKGFTLIELLVVLLVSALAFAALAPLLPAGSGPGEVKAAGRQIGAGMKLARGLAITRNHDESFLLDVGARTYRAADAAVRRLPKSLDLRLLTTRDNAQSATAAGIRFFADGSSTGGRVIVARNGQLSTVTVDWLTGRISIAD